MANLHGRWIYVYNNYPADWKLADLSHDNIVYHCAQFEHSKPTPDNPLGTPHVQGYIELRQRKRFDAGTNNWFKKNFPPEIHWEPARGDATSNIEYCTSEHYEKNGKTKDRDPGTEAYTFGEPSQFQDKFRRYMDMARKRKYNEIADEDPAFFARHFNSIKGAADLLGTKPENLTHTRDVTPNLYLWGDKDVGKSTLARNWLGPSNTFDYDPDSKWFPGDYGDQPVLHIEDLGLDHKHLARFLKGAGDVTPFQVNPKSLPTRWIRPCVVIITSNHPLSKIGFDWADEEAIRSRFVEICVTRDNRDNIKPDTLNTFRAVNTIKF